MGSKPKAPKPDANLVKMQEAEAARVAKEKQAADLKIQEEEAARLRRLRGQRSLLGGTYQGFSLGANNTLG